MSQCDVPRASKILLAAHSILGNVEQGGGVPEQADTGVLNH